MTAQPEALRLPNHQVISFARTITMIGQQKKSRLVNHVESDENFTEKGTSYTADSFGVSNPIAVYDPLGPTPDPKRLDRTRRMSMFQTYADGPHIVGDVEQAEALLDPKNPVTEAMGYGLERRRDETIVRTVLGSQLVMDKDGQPVATALPAGQIVAKAYNKLFKGAADGDAAPATAVPGLTIGKLRRAKIILAKGKYRSRENLKIAVTDEDLEFLRTSVQLTADYDKVNGLTYLDQVNRLADGEIHSFLGFDFIVMEPDFWEGERVAPVAKTGSDYILPVWKKERIHYKNRPLNGTVIERMQAYQWNWGAFYKSQDSGLRDAELDVCGITVSRDTA